MDALLECREEHLEAWRAQANGTDPLLALRARQMMELTADPTPMKKIDLRIVAKVVEHVDVQPTGILNFHFLDGTSMNASYKD